MPLLCVSDGNARSEEIAWTKYTFSKCNLLAEYGEKIRIDVAGEAHYQEHYEVIIGADALQKLALI